MSWEKIDPTQWANALLYLIVGILSAFGIGQVRREKKKPITTQQDVVEIAGAIVSPRDVQQIVDALKSTTAALSVHTVVIQADGEAKANLTAALNRNSDVCDKMFSQLKDTDSSLDQLAIELIRSQHR